MASQEKSPAFPCVDFPSIYGAMNFVSARDLSSDSFWYLDLSASHHVTYNPKNLAVS